MTETFASSSGTNYPSRKIVNGFAAFARPDSFAGLTPRVVLRGSSTKAVLSPSAVVFVSTKKSPMFGQQFKQLLSSRSRGIPWRYLNSSAARDVQLHHSNTP